jgi:hypothetical protein
MIWWAVTAWLFAVLLVCMFVYAAGGGRSLKLHLLTTRHKTRMSRASLCVEAAGHWHDRYIVEKFVAEAFAWCEDCGCMPDAWPESVLKLYVGTARV